MEYLIIILANNAFFIMFGVIIGVWLSAHDKKRGIKKQEDNILLARQHLEKNKYFSPKTKKNKEQKKNKDEIRIPKNIGDW